MRVKDARRKFFFLHLLPPKYKKKCSVPTSTRFFFSQRRRRDPKPYIHFSSSYRGLKTKSSILCTCCETIEGNVLSPVLKFLDFPTTHIVKPIVKRVDGFVTDRTHRVVKGIYVAAKDIHDLVDDPRKHLAKDSPAASHKNLLRQNKELEDRIRFVEELRETESATRKKTEAEVARQRSRANEAESKLCSMKKQLVQEKKSRRKSVESAKVDLDNEKKTLRATISRLERRIELLELELRAQKAEAKVETEKNVYLKRCLEESKETQKSSENEARTLRSRLLQQSEKIAELDEFLRRAKAAAEESERSRREASNELNECRRFLGSMDGKRMQKIEADLAETRLALVQSRAREDELEMMVQQMTGPASDSDYTYYPTPKRGGDEGGVDEEPESDTSMVFCSPTPMKTPSRRRRLRPLSERNADLQGQGY